MEPDQTHLTRLVRAQLDRIADRGIRRRIEGLLVVPRRERRNWDYGELNEQYPCWIVLEHPDSDTGIAYSERGFGPVHPWGLLWLSGAHMSIGMDSGWFETLLEAFRSSMAWERPSTNGEQ